MRIHVVVTDNDGNRYEGEATLEAVAGTLARPRKAARARPAAQPVPGPAALRSDLSFGLSVRAFAKKHTKGLSGPAKFTILLARLTSGEVGATKRLKEVEKAWKRMTGLLGKYNPAYPIRAKDNGWVDTPKHGQHALTNDWKGALSNSGE